MSTTSYWLEEPHGLEAAPPPNEDTGRDGKVDVVVIGGGVTGCSCALTLATGGLRVRLHEAREIAGGASGRNGGFALRGGAMPYDEARLTLGRERARALWALTERSLARIAELAGDAFRPVGSLRLAGDAAEAEAIQRELVALREDGFAGDWCGELGEPLDRLYAGAAFNPGDGALQPARWVRRLARRAVGAGVEIREHSPVGLDDLAVPIVVVATDGLTSLLASDLAPIIRPVRGQVLVTEPLAERLFMRPHYARHGYDYWQQLEDGRLVIGGRRDTSFETEYTATEETTARIQESLESHVVELLGRLPRITHRWAGIWGETPDRLPLAGRLPGREGIWIAGGYSGHGNVLGFACGELVARAILGDRAQDLEVFDPARFAQS
ncbi:MAG TPA: FAD-dependent oxidoreductase [Gaiellaceae bacterium]|nr:FAD-dependent oxidoreductase [Gaiellaceae bacterium]